MGVACQHKVDVGGGQHFPAPMGGVVAQQDAEHALCASRCLGQVGKMGEGWIAVVLYADNGNTITIM